MVTGEVYCGDRLVTFPMRSSKLEVPLKEHLNVKRHSTGYQTFAKEIEYKKSCRIYRYSSLLPLRSPREHSHLILYKK